MINLQTIIDGLEMVDDMNRFFLDTETNDTVYLSEFDPSLTADTAELMEQHPSRFIPLPTQREINEYGMMEDFICLASLMGFFLLGSAKSWKYAGGRLMRLIC